MHDEPLDRPPILQSKTPRVMTGCGHLYVILTYHEGKLFEVFGKLGKSGNCEQAGITAISIALSVALRSGMDIRHILKSITGIRCQKPFLKEGGTIMSCYDALAKIVEENYEQKLD